MYQVRPFSFDAKALVATAADTARAGGLIRLTADGIEVLQFRYFIQIGDMPAAVFQGSSKHKAKVVGLGTISSKLEVMFEMSYAELSHYNKKKGVFWLL